MARSKNPYIVSINAGNRVRFANDQDAQMFAQVYSEWHRVWTHVYAPEGLIGQYDENGHPTSEFANRVGVWHPAGPRQP